MSKVETYEMGETTRHMILQLMASGMSFEDVVAMYPDIPEDQVRKVVRKALRKAPMFL